MFWQEKNTEKNFKIPDDVQDASFAIEANTLPVDHLNLVANALCIHIPWLVDINASIHDLSITSGNGWQSPDQPNAIFYLSRRSKLVIRLPKKYLKKVNILVEKQLKIGPHTITIKKRLVDKKLSDSNIIFARYVDSSDSKDENSFLDNINKTLLKKGIKPKKMLAGLKHQLTSNEGPIIARSLMLADLDKSQSVQLQAQGIGKHRLISCGLFVPQKNIDSVAK